MSSRLDWYPGLMARTRAFLDRHARHLDCFLEITDARAPEAARWAGFANVLGDKPRLLLLTKADLADPDSTRAWLRYYQGVDEHPDVLAVDATGSGVEARRTNADLLKAILAATGRTSIASTKRPAKVAAVGIPNVGKSTVLNLLAGRRRAPAGARPGLTRGRHWIVVSESLWLLDLPGVLPPGLRTRQDVHRLALIGAAPDGAYDETETAFALLRWMLEHDQPSTIAQRLQLEAEPTEADEALEGIDDPGVRQALSWLAAYAVRRGLLATGGRPDTPRAAAVLIAEFRRGALGRITLEMPPAVTTEPTP